ncbi:M56 family metallopeptidase [Niabella drilacis]|uniref:TonB protein C-terminal n=1 Tax=Niabella drilacis (strain DSM 25811 / CCM 8410 / CCUG 62505 / LMG 26954 / E90) TaxID=1285928 RepID=A0A1G6YEW5_NIADE|nr:M56 family metallopeptidase [Niabella drilacis]SDD88543.1 TonB protein C-terminal [Niabella drilacis]
MIAYLLKVILCSGILYMYYHFFLRNERFHQYNRFYLLAATALSIVLPLFRIRFSLEGSNVITQSLEKIYLSEGTAVAVATPAQHTDWKSVAGWAAAAVCLVLVIRLIAGIVKVVQIKNQSQQELLGRITFIRTVHHYAPFSFFNWLFWNKKHTPGSDEGKHILLHEMYHIEKRHSFDLLFTELLLCLFWFNPFFYLYRKEIKMIQEFLADQYAAKDADPLSYASILVTNAIQQKQLHLTNPFFNNQLKRRIAMLTKNNETAYQYLRKIMVLPLSVLVFCLFAFTYQAAASFSETAGFPGDSPLKTLSASLPPVFTEKPSTPPGDTLRIYNDRVISKEAFEKIALGNVATVTVLSKENTQKLYGNSQAAGAIVLLGKGYHSKKLEDFIASRNTNQEEPQRPTEPFTLAVATFSDKNTTAAPVTVQPELNPLSVDGPRYFTSTEKPAVYDGNWNRHMEANIRGEVAVANGAAPGTYRTAYQFVVEKDGTLSNIKPLTAIGYGMEEEGLRVIKKSGKWQPAVQKNQAVRAAYIQIIYFMVAPDKAPSAAQTPDPPADTIPQKAVKEPEIFTKVEQDARYPGDWIHFLSANLRGDTPVKNGAKPGKYQVIVQFIVNTNGDVNDVKVIRDPGFGMGEEAMRVIKISGKWTPAVQNNRVVNAYRKQPITFLVN